MHRPQAPAGTPAEPLSKLSPQESQDCADNGPGGRDGLGHAVAPSSRRPNLWLEPPAGNQGVHFLVSEDESPSAPVPPHPSSKLAGYLTPKQVEICRGLGPGSRNSLAAPNERECELRVQVTPAVVQFSGATFYKVKRAR